MSNFELTKEEEMDGGRLIPRITKDLNIFNKSPGSVLETDYPYTLVGVDGIIFSLAKMQDVLLNKLKTDKRLERGFLGINPGNYSARNVIEKICGVNKGDWTSSRGSDEKLALISSEYSKNSLSSILGLLIGNSSVKDLSEFKSIIEKDSASINANIKSKISDILKEINDFLKIFSNKEKEWVSPFIGASAGERELLSTVVGKDFNAWNKMIFPLSISLIANYSTTVRIKIEEHITNAFGAKKKYLSTLNRVIGRAETSKVTIDEVIGFTNSLMYRIIERDFEKDQTDTSDLNTLKSYAQIYSLIDSEIYHIKSANTSLYEFIKYAGKDEKPDTIEIKREVYAQLYKVVQNMSLVDLDTFGRINGVTKRGLRWLNYKASWFNQADSAKFKSRIQAIKVFAQNVIKDIPIGQEITDIQRKEVGLMLGGRNTKKIHSKNKGSKNRGTQKMH